MPTNRLPPPTRLYPISFETIGSDNSECLTSYVLRLSALHLVTPTVLIRKSLPWVLDRPYLHEGFYKRAGAPMNGVGVVAADWADAFATLTGRPALLGGTWRAWCSIIPPRQLLARHRRWCPPCYTAARDAKKLPADALYWTAAAVTTCVVHQCRLMDVCPSCQHRIPWLPAVGVPGLCPRCQARLDAVPSPPVADPWANRVAQSVAKALAQGPPTQDRRAVATATRRTVETVTQGNAAALAQRIGYPKNTLAGWLSGSHAPTLDGLLRLAAAQGTTLTDWLYGGRGAASAAMIPPPRVTARRRPPHVFPEQQAQALLDHWGSQPTVPPSIPQLAATLQVHPRRLYYKLPTAVRRITAQRKSAQQRNQGARHRAIDAWMHTEVAVLIAAGTYPSRRRLDDRLPRVWSFRDPVVQRAWRREKLRGSLLHRSRT